jgi:hypothetical protein
MVSRMKEFSDEDEVVVQNEEDGAAKAEWCIKST